MINNDTAAVKDELAKQLEHARAIATHTQAATVLLAGVHHELRRRPQSFDLDAVTGKFATPQDARGTVRMVHNPTTAPVLLTMTNGSSGPPRFNATLAAGESREVYVHFNSGLFCAAGAGCVLGGEYDA